MEITVRDIYPVVEAYCQLRTASPILEEGRYELLRHNFEKALEELDERVYEMEGGLERSFMWDGLDFICAWNPESQPWEIAVMAMNVINHMPEV